MMAFAKPNATTFFYNSCLIFLGGLFFVGGFSIKRSFLPLICLGSISAVIYTIQQVKYKLYFQKQGFTLFSYLVIGLCGWIGISTFWGINFALEFLTALRFYADILLAWFVFMMLPCLSEAQLTILKRILLIVFAGILVVGALDISWYWINGESIRESSFRRNMILLLGLLWPLSYYIKKEIFGWKKKTLLAIFFIFITLLSFFGPMSITIFSCLFGFISFALIRFSRSFFYIILALSALLFSLILPVILLNQETSFLMEHLHDVIPTSWQHRIFIWSTVTDKFIVHPFIGWGAEAARYMKVSLGTQAAIIQYGETLYMLKSDELLPIHAHQGWLQILMELGLIGMGLVLACWVQGALQLSRLYKKEFHWMAATFFTLLVPFSVSFGIWQTSWISIWIYSVLAWRLVLLSPGSKES